MFARLFNLYRQLLVNNNKTNMLKLKTFIPLDVVKGSKALQGLWMPEKRDENIFELLFHGYEININREESEDEDEEAEGFYIRVAGEDGCYLYDGCYTKSEDMNDAIFDAIDGSQIYEDIAPTIADVIDNAEMLFGEDNTHVIENSSSNFSVVENYSFTAERILRMCQQDKSIQEVAAYIIKNLK